MASDSNKQKAISKKQNQAQVVPTVTAFSPDEYNSQLGKLEPFAQRVHFDFTDGLFAPSKTINLIQAHWPEDVAADLHVMYKNPADHTETIISLKPRLVILHVEAAGDLPGMLAQLKAVGIKTGIALLPATSVASHQEVIRQVDHVLIFSGRLGFQGATLETSVLPKLVEVRALNPGAERAIDGGVDDKNILEVVSAGANVINVGGFIQNAADPEAAYRQLLTAAQEAK